MTKVFEEIIWTYVPAKSHSDRTSYFVAIGNEKWGDNRKETVIKVQVAYEKKKCGRKSPSFPLGSDEWNLVDEAVTALKIVYHNGIKGEVVFSEMFKQ